MATNNNTTFDLDAYIKRRRRDIEKALQQSLPRATTRPCQLHKAMRHSLFAGGKRLRPLLTLAAAEACGGDPMPAMPLACAVECIHTFSLIHDDLPCMDDDELRRGVPTCHVVFGEATALLAGDALQALAFELASSHPGSRRHPTATIIRNLAHASGSRCLVGGQVMDMEAEGRDTTPGELRRIHEGKTAALLTSSLQLGGMSANATPSQYNALTTFGHSLGLAFQIIDDILDVTQSSEQLGKTAGKDHAVGKATFPAIIGLDRSRREAKRLTDRALDALETFKSNGTPLRSLANHLLDREC